MISTNTGKESPSISSASLSTSSPFSTPPRWSELLESLPTGTSGGNANTYTQSDMCDNMFISIPLTSEQTFALNKFISGSALVVRSLLFIAQLLPLALHYTYVYKYINVTCQDLYNLGFDLSVTNCECVTCTNCETVSAGIENTWFFTCKYTESVFCAQKDALLETSCMMQSQTTCPEKCTLPS